MGKKLFSLKQIAAAYERPVTTTRDHITKLLLGRLFQKKSFGSSYTENEVKQLEKLLDFKMKR